MKAQDLVHEFSNQLATGFGAIFVGSGISSASNVPSWLALLEGMACSRLNLKINPEDNLPLIAQYIVNKANGNRGPLIQYFKEELTKGYALNEYHTALARTNVTTLWTTNYDILIEDAFRRNFHVNVKATDDAVACNGRNAEIEVIKMHGCIEVSSHNDLVITQEDYENFFMRRPATARRLGQDLLDKSFLFIGYSYGDSNITNILVEARRLSRNATRQHYIILRRIQDEDESKCAAKQERQDLWLGDLARVGIQACQIDEYDELKSILDHIALKSRGKTVFVSGSHTRAKGAGPFDLLLLGVLLAGEKDLILLDGQSAGTSRFVVEAYVENCIMRKVDALKRLRVFHNPYAANPDFSNNSTLLPVLKEWRSPLLKSTQVMVVFDGGMGTKAEVELALNFGCTIIPVPETSDDLPYRLLNDNSEITIRLESIDRGYLEKARNLQVQPEDVMQCIRTILKS